MKRGIPELAWLVILGMGSFTTFLYARTLSPMREHIPEFTLAFLAAFILYAIASTLVLRAEIPAPRTWLWAMFGFGAGFFVLMVCTQPSLSDDMYRYIWDGRVQAQGISPYRYPPLAEEVRYLRDADIWPLINRKSVVTVYPPAAEITFGLLWHIQPDNVRWFQIITASASLLAGGLLLGLLRDLGRSPARVLIYLWSPLLIYETAHSAHLDGLILPLVVGAMWGRVRKRDGLTGALLGLAAAIKFYPALLLPALWRPNHRIGRWSMPLMFIGVITASYLPFLAANGKEVVGFLPDYLGERFNLSPVVYWLLRNLPGQRLADSQRTLQVLTLALLGLSSLAMVIRPAHDAESALRRGMWLMAIFLLLNPNLFSWYLLWLLPLAAIFLEPGLVRMGGKSMAAGLRLDAWTGWWLFSGLSALSYTFFIAWKVVPLAIQAQFWPLYALLAVDLARQLRGMRLIAPKLRIAENLKRIARR